MIDQENFSSSGQPGKLSAFGLSYIHLLRFLTIYLVYSAAVTFVVVYLTGAPASLFDLEFGFGPKIALVADGKPLGDASRLPFLPYFLGWIARFWDNYSAALLLKNVLFHALTAWIFLRLWLAARGDWLTAALLVYLLTFPQWVRHGFSLIPEEAYLIPMLGFVFWGLLQANSATVWTKLAPYAVVTALTFLTKSSMLLLAPVVCLIYWRRTRSVRVLLLFSGLLVASAVGWGAMNHSNTGVFSITSSLNGYDFWKGNNAQTIDYFPHRSLDAISSQAPLRTEGQSEWDWSRECFRRGISFNIENPATGLKLFGLRIYQVFFAVTAEDSPSWGAARGTLKIIGVAYMLVFRALLLLAIACAVTSIWRWYRNNSHSTRTREAMELGLAYLLYLAAFVAPYLAAWGTERRLMPIVVPTCLYLWMVYRTNCAAAPDSNLVSAHSFPVDKFKVKGML